MYKEKYEHSESMISYFVIVKREKAFFSKYSVPDVLLIWWKYYVTTNTNIMYGLL